ncbi:FtsB family cell division protein [Bifidobacterium thermacidophilum]|uniref:Septum formation initiator domain protein n=1 Tax=Bifidobacterium thermacidophilum subsp. thermacidophilum TaxID=79262 RepID=A0A087E4A0_9BIFI|nr:septum formation initiator family protein [Bifidobacterium thermacidophilum]KFJ02601.1 septum formation initiator domain protein [Bifidobacterium thermacidophilum subsp. thermacidophilum]
MTTSSRKPARQRTQQTAKTRRNSGPVSFFIAVIIVIIGLMQLVSTFHDYALNLSELNGLKKQEATLEAQKQDLENDIARWDDKAYVTAQARERLGFVFPGEVSVRVEHPEAVTGSTTSKSSGTSSAQDEQTTLPWYKELAYAFQQADTPSRSSSSSSSSSSSGSGSSDNGSGSMASSGSNASPSPSASASDSSSPSASQ